MLALEDVLMPVLFWGSPIGLSVFFVGLGYLIKCAAYAARKEKQDKEAKG